jgi:hypothetical protein
MIIVLSVAGMGVLLAGLVAIGFGIQVKEFSLGNTLILAGVVAACSGLIMLSLAVLVRELRAIVWRFGPADQQPAVARGRGDQRPPSVFADPEPVEEPAAAGPLFLRDQPALEPAAPVVPWQEEVARDRARPRGAMPSAPPAELPEAKPRRDLSFSSSSRKERTATRAPDPLVSDLDMAIPAVPMGPPIPPPPPEAGPATSFEDAWPPPETVRSDPFRRSPRRPSTFNAGASAPADDRSQVTILKSGVVDGMAYSLYSDGSIEAQMPEGMMRFGSIGELRAHLDQRT